MPLLLGGELEVGVGVLLLWSLPAAENWDTKERTLFRAMAAKLPLMVIYVLCGSLFVRPAGLSFSDGLGLCSPGSRSNPKFPVHRVDLCNPRPTYRPAYES